MPSALARRKPLPRPSPESDPRFRRVMDQLKVAAARTKAHPPASKKANEAAAAAKGPPNERAAAGKAKQVDKIQEAPAQKPESSTFLALLRAEIDKAMPKTLGDTEKFGQTARQMKGGLQNKATQQKDEAASGVAGASRQAPGQEGEAKAGTPIPPEGAAAAPNVAASEGMPAPKTDAEVSLQDSKQETDQQMQEAEITPAQLRKANDPRFSAVLDAKQQVAAQADRAPAQYRGSERATLTGAAAAAQNDARQSAAAMVGVRRGSGARVLSRQQLQRDRDESKRREVVTNIENIYKDTKKRVDDKLSSLDTEVSTMFDQGTEAALSAMTTWVDARILRYKLDRYLSDPILGPGRWIVDQILNLPPEVNVFFEQARELFRARMDALIVRVASLVEKRLQEAKDEVARGQAAIKTYVKSLGPELRNIGQQAQRDMASRFEELTQSIDDKKNDLAQSLATKYKEAFDKANETLKQKQDENKGLGAAFKEKLDEVTKALTEFKARLAGVLRKGEETLKLIIADPIGFLGNLIGAVAGGIRSFAANIETHMIEGFKQWLFGSMSKMGIEIPRDFSLPSILKLVLSVLGITYDRMRAKAVRLIGERNVRLLEKLVEYIRTLITGGPAALWELVQQDLSTLKEMVIDAIRNYVIETAIKRGIAKVVAMFNPVGAIVGAIMAIYDIVMFVVEKAQQILAFVESVVSSVHAIATGNISGAVAKVEQALARTIPLLIGFLAQFAGLGKVADKIQEFIRRVQARVDKAIDKAIAKIVGIVKKLFGRGGGGRDRGADSRTDEQKRQDLRKAVEESKALDPASKKPRALRRALDRVKEKYRLTSLVATPGQTRAQVVAKINPEAAFELESADASWVAQQIYSRTSPKIAALDRKATRADVESILQAAFKTLRITDGKLEFKGGNEKQGILADVWVHCYGADEKVGSIWNTAALYEPVGGYKAATFKNKKTGAIFVHDHVQQLVPYKVSRFISKEDMPNLKRGLLSTWAMKGRGHKPTPDFFRHVAGQKPSVLISVTRQTSSAPQDVITSFKGESFNDYGKVDIDLRHISSDNIYDLSTATGQKAYGLANPTTDVGRVVLADVIRTQEVVIKDEIPAEAIIRYYPKR